jgi:hypothetical protein
MSQAHQRLAAHFHAASNNGMHLTRISAALISNGSGGRLMPGVMRHETLRYRNAFRRQSGRRKLTVTDQIRFDDGAAYERYMGEWSRLAGETFLEWLAPESGLRWLDVGCGNGAFTEMLV